MGRLDDDGDAVVVTVAEPVEGHVVLLTRLGRVTHKRFMGGQQWCHQGRSLLLQMFNLGKA